MVALAKVPVRMSLDEFLNWEPGDGFRYELVDGEPRAMAPARPVHGFLQNELGSLIRDHLRQRGSPCMVIANPGIIPRLLSQHNMRIPDLAVTCAPLLPGQVDLPEPLLVVEILSPSNQAKTWTNVWTYTSIPSLREILVLRTDRIGAELLRRGADGGWPEQTSVIGAGELTLESIGFRVALAELYAATPLRGE